MLKLGQAFLAFTVLDSLVADSSSDENTTMDLVLNEIKALKSRVNILEKENEELKSKKDLRYWDSSTETLEYEVFTFVKLYS